MPLLSRQRVQKRRRSLNKALVADIQRASLHDGKGIRTTVFFKGCPLRCEWCHNPECISFEKEVLHYPEKCIGCGGCAEGCYSGAKVFCGREMSADEILEEIKRDKPYYGKDGGVTFSGGEPMAQKEIIRELIPLCKNEGIGCAMETSLIYFDEKIFGSLDFIMADLKIFDSELHRKYTGVGNEQIKKNFKRLDKLGIPIIMRTPVIPEIEQGIREISELAYSLKNVVQYELLPYHPLGNSKRAALGQSVPDFTMPTKEFMKEVNRYAFIRR